MMERSIDFEFGAPPVSPLGIVADGVVGLVAEPVGKGSILPLFFGESFFHKE